MPVQWTAENDQKVFLAVLDLFEGPIPHARIAQKLQAMGLDVTTKAVSHRIAKLKNDAKAGKTTTYGRPIVKSGILDGYDDEAMSPVKTTTRTPKPPRTSKYATDRTPKDFTEVTTPSTANTETKRKRVLGDIGFHTEAGFKKPMHENDFGMEETEYNMANYDQQMGGSPTPIACPTRPSKGYSPILKTKQEDEEEGHYNADVSDTGEYYAW
ncbi:hypothetical protein HDK77DRAFT_209460 [Phyllosticta capitalensis]